MTFFISSCVPEEFNPIELSDSEIIKAKNWFESQGLEYYSNFRSQNLRTTSEALQEIIKYPEWGNSLVHQTAKGTVIEVSLSYDTYISVVKGESPLISGRSDVLHSLLLFEQGDGYEIFIMKIFPEDNYSFKKNDFKSINYATVRSNFNGNFRFYSWDESYIGGFTVKEGLKTHHLVTPLIPEDNKARIQDYYCYKITTIWYSVACGGGGCGDPVVIDVTTAYECEYISIPPSMEDPGGGGGGGIPPGSGGECLMPHPFLEGVYIPCHGEPEEPEEPENICEQVQQLQTNALFMQKMGTLKNAADNFNYEIGYKIIRNSDGTFNYEFVPGNPGSGTLDGLDVNSPIDGIIHSHYSGQNMLSIFSVDDISSLGAMVEGNLINNIDNFIFGVVTPGGTYLLSISNLVEFSNFYGNLDILGAMYNNFVNPTNTLLQNEIGLINFLELGNSGLTLFKGNTSNFNSWNMIGRNRQGTNIVNLNCN